jgi:putative endonuclease
MPPAVWHLYVIECADGSLYTGIATDVDRRFKEHLAGRGARYTRARKAVRLVASHPIGSRSEALRAEIAIKQLPRERKVEAVKSLAFVPGHENLKAG